MLESTKFGSIQTFLTQRPKFEFQISESNGDHKTKSLSPFSNKKNKLSKYDK